MKIKVEGNDTTYVINVNEPSKHDWEEYERWKEEYGRI